MTVPELSRRRALTGVATLGLALPVLAACGGGSDDTSDTSSSSDGSTPSTSPTSKAASTAPATPSASAAAGLVATADVPVGSGVVITDQRVVVTQPTQGEFKCFTAVCTHTGCLVNSVSTTINCPCHGSTYDISTGDVTGGPAPSPLAAVQISVTKGEVALA